MPLSNAVVVGAVAPSGVSDEDVVTGTVVVDQYIKDLDTIRSFFKCSAFFVAGGSSFRVMSHIADGTLSSVYHVLNEDEGRFRALKVVPVGAANTESYLAELETLRRLHHPNIVKSHGHFVQRFNNVKCLCIELEYCAKRTLFDYLRGKQRWRGKLSAENVLMFTTQLVSALKYLHMQGQVHGYIRPKNILIDGDRQLKLTSFGRTLWIERHGQARPAIMLYDRAYAPPECPNTGLPEHRQGSWTPQPSYDMWSLGCVLSVLVTLKFLGHDRHCTTAMAANPPLHQRILSEVAALHNGLFSPLCTDLLAMDDRRRMTADEAHLQISRLLRTMTSKPQGISPRSALGWLSTLTGGSSQEARHT